MQWFAGNVLIVRFGWRVAGWIERQRLAALRRSGISRPGWRGMAGVWIVLRFAGLRRRQRARFDRSGPDCARRRFSRQRIRPALRHDRWHVWGERAGWYIARRAWRRLVISKRWVVAERGDPQ